MKAAARGLPSIGEQQQARKWRSSMGFAASRCILALLKWAFSVVRKRGVRLVRIWHESVTRVMPQKRAEISASLGVRNGAENVEHSGEIEGALSPRHIRRALVMYAHHYEMMINLWRVGASLMAVISVAYGYYS